MPHLMLALLLLLFAPPVGPADVAVELDRALREGDVETVVRILHVPGDAGEFARAWVGVHAEAEALRAALRERFAEEQAQTLAERMKLGPVPSENASDRIEYVVRGDQAFPNPTPGVEYRIRAHTLRNVDGTWKADLGLTPEYRDQMVSGFEASAAEMRERRRQVIESGKTAEQWLAETDPERGRAERTRQRRAEQQQQRLRWLEEERPAAEAADPATLEGALRKLRFAIVAMDVDAAAGLAHVDGDPRGALPRAHFDRQFAVMRLAEAAAPLEGDVSEVLRTLGHLRREDDGMSLLLTRWEVDGDVAHGKIEGEESPFRLKRVDGKWKLDLTRLTEGDPAAAAAEHAAMARAARAGLEAIEVGTVRTHAGLRDVLVNALPPEGPLRRTR